MAEKPEMTREIERRLRDAAADADEVSFARTLRDLADAGGSVGAADPRTGLTALHVASGAGNVAAIRVLLRAGASADAEARYGETPLLRAARARQAAACRVLVEIGRASVDKDDHHGLTALVVSAAWGADELVRTLLALGATPRAAGGRLGALALGASRCDASTVAALLAAGADPNEADPQGTPSIVRAAERGDGGVDVVRVLVAGGADPSRADASGVRAIDLALAREYREIVAALEAPGSLA